MKAAVYKGNRQLSVEEIPTPEPGPHQVLVRVKYCAICGTDVHGVLYDAVPPGSVLGHEYCGTIAHVGSEVTRWKEGDRIVGGGGTHPDGVRPGGVRSDPRFNYRTMGFSGNRTRGYAEYTVMEEWEPVTIPDGVSDEAAALCEPCSIAVHAGPSVGWGATPVGVRPVSTRAFSPAATSATLATRCHFARMACTSALDFVDRSSWRSFAPSCSPSALSARVGSTRWAWWLRASPRRSGRCTAQAHTVS